LETALRGIEQLNARHGRTWCSLFYRHRVWSETEQSWMGWERKRGKLEELNRFLVAKRAPSAERLPELKRQGAGTRTWARSTTSATQSCSQTCGSSSRSMPTRNCRTTPPADW
jgi:hypothetical protein